MAITLVLAGDHPIVLDALGNLFGKEPDITVLTTCFGAVKILDIISQHRPDVLILNYQVPGNCGLDVLRHVKNENLPTRVVFLAVTLDEDVLIEAVRLGISGVVLMETAPDLIVRCVRKVHAGEQWLERRFYIRALEILLQRKADSREVARILTPREIEIVLLVSAGLSNRHIGKKLFISERTVKTHLHHIFEKLRVGNRYALVVYAQAKGLILRAGHRP